MAVPQVMDRVRSGGKASDVFDTLVSLSHAGVQAVRERDLTSWLECIDRYAETLHALGATTGVGIVSDMHARAREVAKHHGLVYKPSGAGIGDMGVAFGRAIPKGFAADLGAKGLHVLAVELA